MKKLLVLTSMVLLSACSAPKQQQIDFTPQIISTPRIVVNDVAFALTSKDVRSAQYVALVDSGRSQITPIHSRQNLRLTMEHALSEQFAAQGFRSTTNSDNNLTIEIQEALVAVKHSITSHEMNAVMTIELTVETPRGKLVKSYNGSAQRKAAFSTSNQDIEKVLNDVANLVLNEIANDSELQTYMKERFNA